MRKAKINLIFNTIAPTFIPVFNYIAQKSGCDFKIFFMKDKEYNRDWNIQKNNKFNYEILSGLHLPIKRMEWEMHFNPIVWLKLKKANPDVIIICGYDAPTAWLAFLYAKLYKKKIIFWNGSTLLSSRKNKGLIVWLKRKIIKSSDAFITYGNAAKDYLLYLGAPENKVFTGCNVGDPNFFRSRVDFCPRKKNKTESVFLFVGQLIPRKGIIESINVLTEIRNRNWKLIIVGNGPLDSEIRRLIKNHNLESRIKMVGFRRKHELVKYYAMADIFLFPSLKEVYGIVLSEALASGLFSLASKYAGATYDLLQDRINGYLIDPKNHEDLEKKMRLAMDHSHSRKKISHSISKFTPEYYGQQIIKAIKSVL